MTGPVNLLPINIADSVAVVTGGASGIGKGIVGALLRAGATVVIADIEQRAIDETTAELTSLGPVSGHRTDITDEASVKALADHVYATHGKVNLLYNNAGVTSGGGGKPWQQEPNDWRWCFGVNVFGTAFSCPGTSSTPHQETADLLRYPPHRSTPHQKRPSRASPKPFTTTSSARERSSEPPSSTQPGGCNGPGSSLPNATDPSTWNGLAREPAARA
jgi:NAD(P)-dependent dehydrogenase (short-subunit alcohol dehydrogenase family)